MISIFLNLLRLALCPMMRSIFEHVPCTPEKNVYFAYLGWKALYISVKSISSSVFLSDTISFLIFFLEELSIFDSVVLKSPTIIVFDISHLLICIVEPSLHPRNQSHLIIFTILLMWYWFDLLIFCCEFASIFLFIMVCSFLFYSVLFLFLYQGKTGLKMSLRMFLPLYVLEEFE